MSSWINWSKICHKSEAKCLTRTPDRFLPCCFHAVLFPLAPFGLSQHLFYRAYISSGGVAMGTTTIGIQPEIPAVAAGRRPRVLILGGGFAGLNAAMALAKLPVDI